MDIEAKIVEARAAGSTMRGQLESYEHEITGLKTQMADAELAPEKLTDETPQMEADL